jgi:hypothetical protein
MTFATLRIITTIQQRETRRREVPAPRTTEPL